MFYTVYPLDVDMHGRDHVCKMCGQGGFTVGLLIYSKAWGYCSSTYTAHWGHSCVCVKLFQWSSRTYSAKVEMCANVHLLL